MVKRIVISLALALAAPGIASAAPAAEKTFRYAFLIAIDVLAYGAAIRMKGPAREKLRRIKQQFAAFRDSEDNLPLCD